MLRLVAGGALLVWALPAAAAPIADPGPLDGTELLREVVPPTNVTRAQSRTIFLNRNGATVRPGINNASAQTSTIVTQPVVIKRWDVTAATWTATVACMHELWARFDVTVTEVDPGMTPHVEALFGGSPADIGHAAGVAGIAPFAADCGVVESSIVFAFTDNLPNNARMVCEVMSQEIGHSYGLDHELLAADPMSYLPFAGDRAFQETAVSCGEKTARPCGLGPTACRAQQSSLEILLARLGAAGGDGTAPTLVITSPSEYASVQRGFAVTANAADDHGVTGVTLYVDGTKIETRTTGPFEFTTDAALAIGSHTVMVEARDTNDNIIKNLK